MEGNGHHEKGKGHTRVFRCDRGGCGLLFASGCLGTGPSEATKAQWKPKFVGTWDLQEAKGDSSYSAEDLQLVREMGYDFYLELKEDGTAALVIDDDKTSGTWEVKSENVATFSTESD